MKFFFFGVVQGITEFLPISSDGHLFLLKRLCGINDNYLPFFVFLHLPTLFAVCFFFRQQLKEMIIKRNLLLYIALITCVSGIFAFFLKHYLEFFFDNKYFVAICFLANGLVLLFTRRIPEKKMAVDITAKDASIIGVLQAIAVLPGISRSAMTITGFLRRGVKMGEAFSLSFLISIPLIIAAFLVEWQDLLAIKSLCILSLFIGFITAFITGIIALKIAQQIFLKVKFRWFGYYCLLLGVVSLVL